MKKRAPEWRAFFRREGRAGGCRPVAGSVGARWLQVSDESIFVLKRTCPWEADDFAFLNDDESWRRVNLIGVMHGAVIGIHGVDFYDGEGFRVFLGDLVDDRRHQFAGFAIGLPEIEQDFTIGFLEDFREPLFSDSVWTEYPEPFATAKENGYDDD